MWILHLLLPTRSGCHLPLEFDWHEYFLQYELMDLTHTALLLLLLLLCL